MIEIQNRHVCVCVCVCIRVCVRVSVVCMHGEREDQIQSKSKSHIFLPPTKTPNNQRIQRLEEDK